MRYISDDSVLNGWTRGWHIALGAGMAAGFSVDLYAGTATLPFFTLCGVAAIVALKIIRDLFWK